MRLSFYPGSILVPITAQAMESAHLGTPLPAECTVNVTNTGKARPVTSLTAETTAAAPTTVTAILPARSFVSAMTAGKVRVRFFQALQVFIQCRGKTVCTEGILLCF